VLRGSTLRRWGLVSYSTGVHQRRAFKRRFIMAITSSSCWRDPLWVWWPVSWPDRPFFSGLAFLAGARIAFDLCSLGRLFLSQNQSWS
jgi:hypothetical protein